MKKFLFSVNTSVFIPMKKFLFSVNIYVFITVVLFYG